MFEPARHRLAIKSSEIPTDNPNDNDKCVVCKQIEADSDVESELLQDWIECITCHKWAHQECAINDVCNICADIVKQQLGLAMIEQKDEDN